MTTTRKNHAHGTENRYKGTRDIPGCRCQPCTKAAVRADAQREIDRLAGRHRLIPAAPVQAHIRHLRDTGLSDTQIGAACGVHQTVISKISNQAKIRRTTADRILAVPLTHRATSGMTSSLGSTRRLRALYVLGHSRADMASRIGICRDYVSRIARGEFAQISTEHDHAIRRMYAELSTARGKSTHTGPYAARQRWHGPMAWHDIDDPAAVPEVGEFEDAWSKREAREALAAARAEDIAHLASFGLSADHIATRVGLTADYVRDQINGIRGPGWRDQAVSA
ncbi:hypothetical protein [Streptacidiphilus cavernicola]|uniref:Uncharacterized protein n=1 Tax=Streptacidiphilus cavernicola TaxID=3342716 RepID=A0ABV6W471_9ACTN